MLLESKKMKTLILNLFLFVAFILTSTAHAEIYKWKDKEGYTRYSDTPPNANIKAETLGNKKTAKSINQTQLSTAAANPQTSAEAANKAPTQGEAPTQGDLPPIKNAEEAAAQKRRADAELDKKAKQEKEVQAKMKAENCKAAKSNLESYVQGGRIFKMNEKGEREYLDDAGLKKGADKSRGEVSKYCS